MFYFFLEPKLLNTTRDAVYPLQSMTLNCPESTVKNTIQWSVNEKAPDSNKYSISPNGVTLTLKSAHESDSGESLSCL